MNFRLCVVSLALASFAGCTCVATYDPCDGVKCVKPLVCDSSNGRCVNPGAGGGSAGGTGGGVAGGFGGGTGGGSAGGSGGGAAGGMGGGTAGGTGGTGGVGGGSAGGSGGGSAGGAGGTGGGTAGGTGGGTAGGAGGGTFYDFDGGWQIPVAPPQPPLIGDGGTTIVIGTGADAMSPTKFGGATTGGAISVVYPPTGVMVPPNTNSIEFHFIPAAGQTLFRFTFVAPTTTLAVYTGCTAVGGGCVYTPDVTFWSNLVAFARGTAAVTWTVSGVNGATPGAVGSSPPQTIQFGQNDIKGGLYYWNTAGVIQRYDYGFPNANPQNYLTAGNIGALVCVGCHHISRQGNRIVAGKDIPSPAPYSALEVVSKNAVTTSSGAVSGSANFFSFSPDEMHLLTSDGVSTQWRELYSGTSKQAVSPGTMPDWAPDGLHMVYAKPSSSPFFAVPGVASASLNTMHFNGTGWDMPSTLVPFSGQNNYYPAYSPDGKWVAFNRSPSNAESFSNAAPSDAGYPDGELWAVNSSGGTPIRLSKASDPGALSWPKWAPVLHDYSGGKIMWLTFSSARPYGLRLGAWQKTQLWMMAFDPAKAAAGMDPSFPAFWLPFQSLSTGNHIGQWSLQVPRATCVGVGQSTCQTGENCINGKCNPG